MKVHHLLISILPSLTKSLRTKWNDRQIIINNHCLFPQIKMKKIKSIFAVNQQITWRIIFKLIFMIAFVI